ncbi:MAG: MmcQ/YjbR family DNA-binding protein [Acidimicrobiia bacterium]
MATSRRERELARVRTVCAGLPEVEERLSHGSPSFFVRGKKTLAMFVDDHHGDGILGIWCAAPPGVQAEMIDEDPDVFFRPPYVGHRGWIGVRLSRAVTDEELRLILEDAYRVVAPKTLAARLDGSR